MKKYIYEEVNGEIKTKLNPEFKKLRDKKIYNIMLKFSKIPLDYYELDFENFSNNIINSKEELNKCIKYAKECKEEKFKKISLYLVGENSSGKSTIACAIGKEFIRQGLIVKFVYAGTLISYLMKNSLFNREEESLKELEELKNCDLIIIDDAMDDKKSSMWKGTIEMSLVA
jgi:DNA replication protein DnaC